VRKERDCILKVKRLLLANNLANEDELTAIDEKVANQI